MKRFKIESGKDVFLAPKGSSLRVQPTEVEDEIRIDFYRGEEFLYLLFFKNCNFLKIRLVEDVWPYLDSFKL